MADAPKDNGTVDDVKQLLREALNRKHKENHTEHPGQKHFAAKDRDAGPGKAKFFRRKTG